LLPQSQQAALRFALKARSSRQNWDTLFERLALMFLPNRSGFTSERTDGEDLEDHLNSSAPALARRGLASAVSTMLRPAGRHWFRGSVKFHALNADASVRLWLDQVTQIMFDAMYDPRARMEPNLAMCDDDLVTFGNGCVRMGWDIRGSHLRFRTRSMTNTYYVVDASGQVVGLITFEMWTLRQLIERFGKDKLTKQMKRDLDQSNRENGMDKEYELVHIVVPVSDAKAMGMTVRKPWSSLWMSVTCKESLEAKGFDYFPYLTPRWDLSTGETYGRSPAMVALKDAQLLQAMTETVIDAGEKALNPPTWGYGDAISGLLDLSAGGFTPVEASFPGNQAPINPIQLGTLPREIFEFISVVEERIYSAFYRDILELPSARDKDLTATEINARLDQYMRQAAPVFSRIEHSYNAPLVETVYKILEMNGQLPQKPDMIQMAEEYSGEDAIEFEYESPIKTARDKAEAMKIFEGMQMLAGGAATMGEQAVMAVAENFNPDAFARGVGGMKLDLPEWLFTPMEEMIAMRQQRMQAAEAQMQADMIQKVAPGAAQLGKLVPEAAKAGLIDQGPDQALLPAPEGIPFEDIEGLAGEIL